MAGTKTDCKLTKSQVSEGLDTLSKWFPEEASSIKKHRDAIIRHIVEGMGMRVRAYFVRNLATIN